MKFDRRLIDVNVIVGALLAFPLAVPSEPFYLFALGGFALLAHRMRVPRGYLVTLFGFMALVMASTFVAIHNGGVSMGRAGYTTLAFFLFLFGFAVTDRDAFVRGYALGSVATALAIIAGFLVLRPFTAGLALLYMPEYRLWGAGVFPDWPNFLGFGLGLGALVNAVERKAPLATAICLTGALCTTSRTAVVAAGVLGLIVLRDFHLRSTVQKIAIAGVAVTAGGIAFYQVADLLSILAADPQVVSRLFKTSDRALLWASVGEVVVSSPLTGLGPVRLNESVGIAGTSIHNSYFDIAVRYGLPAVLVWLLGVLRLPWVIARAGDARFIALYFLLTALAQNVLRHPHFMMLYSALVIAAVARPGRSTKIQEPDPGETLQPA